MSMNECPANCVQTKGYRRFGSVEAGSDRPQSSIDPTVNFSTSPTPDNGRSASGDTVQPRNKESKLIEEPLPPLADQPFGPNYGLLVGQPQRDCPAPEGTQIKTKGFQAQKGADRKEYTKTPNPTCPMQEDDTKKHQ